MKVILDTQAYSDFCRGRPEAKDAVQRAEQIVLPIMVLAELRAGFACGSRSAHNEAQLNRFLASPRVQILAPDEETTYHYARLFSQLRKQGTPIPTNDLWIAALAAQHELYLFSTDKHFDLLPQILRC